MTNSNIINNGLFVISLDFELMWGVRDKKTVEEYGDHILNGKIAILEMLKLFSKFKVKSTFATVGFLFHNDISELLKEFPSHLPNYRNEKLDPYNSIQNKTEHYKNNHSYYFCPELIGQVMESESHEIATHTYSHYYCLENGQSTKEFEADIIKAKKIANSYGIELKSIIFPRNQYSSVYLRICMKHGIENFRGNEEHFAYKSSNQKGQTYFKRIVRLIDTYFNISGHHCSDLLKNSTNKPINIPASRFLRPYSKKLNFLEKLKVNRIKKSMTYAATNNKIYHLWWHPHNFGSDLTENLKMLEEVLNHYSFLNQNCGFQSCTMKEVGELISQK